MSEQETPCGYVASGTVQCRPLTSFVVLRGPPCPHEAADGAPVIHVIPVLVRLLEGPLGPPNLPVHLPLVVRIVDGRLSRFRERNPREHLVRLHEEVRDQVALGVEVRTLLGGPEARREPAGDRAGGRGVHPVPLLL